MFKRLSYTAIMLACFGGTFALTPPEPVSAAQHTITWHGKHYRSKYSISQMRRKYRLRYFKTKDIAHVTWIHHQFWGVRNGANIHVGGKGETHAHGNVTHKGRYAMFLTSQINGGNAYSMEYINLKTGKHYHDQA